MSLLLARRRLRATAASLLLSTATSTFALDTATIVSSALSPDCLEYRVAGICYWLYCTPFGCSVRTSVKVRHYVPDAVVSSYSNTGENPWREVRAMSMPNPTAKAGGDGTTNHDNENNLAKFKKRYKVSVVEISCLTASGLEKLKQTLLKQVIKLRGADKIRLMK